MNLTTIDGELLAKALKERGLSPRKASKEIGYNDCFLQNCISRNKLNAPAAILLKTRFNIDVEDLIPVKPKQQTLNLETPTETRELAALIVEALKFQTEEICTLLEDIKQSQEELLNVWGHRDE